MLKILVKHHPDIKSTQKEESAFTLLELIITVLVIGVLTAIATFIAADQQKQAIIATVRADVSANKGMMSPGVNGRLYATTQKFLSGAASTDKNVTYYTVNPNFSEACTHTTRVISEKETVTWRLWTRIGKQEPLPCPDLGGETVTTNPSTPGGSVGGETVTPTPTPTPTPSGDPKNTDGGYGTDPISPGNVDTQVSWEITENNFYHVCYRLSIKTTSPTGAPWAVRINNTLAPFADGNFIEALDDSRYILDNHGTYYTLYGVDGKALATTSAFVIANFCAKAPSDRNFAIIPKKIPSLIISQTAPNGGAWYAYQSFVVGNSSQYVSGWQVEVDLTALLNLASSATNRTPHVDSNIQIEKVSGNIYRVSSLAGSIGVKNDKTTGFDIRVG